MSDVRTFDGADGRYLHAEDLAAMFTCTAEETDNPLAQVVLPNVVQAIRYVAGLPATPREEPV